tara:strand:- start:176 stop:334 length:159 start_codon:yes stop_codon:yes gene_type:complete
MKKSFVLNKEVHILSEMFWRLARTFAKLLTMSGHLDILFLSAEEAVRPVSDE